MSRASEDSAPDAKQVRSAIDAGLHWLAEKQVRDGAEAGGWGNPRYQTAVASFAGLAFLANGYEPGKGDYGDVVLRALQFVQASMTPDGYLGSRDNSMYVHAIATLFGLSCLGRSAGGERDRELAEWCRRSLALTLAAQKVKKTRLEQGGWRYSPFSNDSDLSVTSWQLLTLHAARQCGYEIDEAVFEAAMKYVNGAYLVTETGKAGFLYRVGASNVPEPAVTGVAVFLKSLFERDSDEKIEKALEYLEDFSPGWGGRQYNGFFYFGSFYMAQGTFQRGDEAWSDFAPKIQRVLLDHQEADGHWGFPPDNSPQSHPAGHAYTTALALLILSLDRQYLPMFQRQSLQSP
ncbi:MAG: terpene cyclase/mutase family protein [Planctomycetes bacterium]|nr:terpene cyclase/mutase family protein [Planctomycetota bacterium]